MSDAGLTRGAFYAHFSSKSELYAEGIISAAKAARQQVVQPLPDTPALTRLQRNISAGSTGKAVNTVAP